jgi:hypothetical protein
MSCFLANILPTLLSLVGSESIWNSSKHETGVVVGMILTVPGRWLAFIVSSSLECILGRMEATERALAVLPAVLPVLPVARPVWVIDGLAGLVRGNPATGIIRGGITTGYM